MPEDVFHFPYFYPTKPSGYVFEQSSNPKNDSGISDLDSSFSVSNGVITMKCSGPTSFSVAKNGNGFNGSIGGCGMDFSATAKRGYAYKQDDVRDLEFKCSMRIPNNLSSGHDGFSMSCRTGKHSASGCCQSFAYMGSMEGINSNPTKFRFRKETTHPNYQDSSEGIWSHPKCNFKVAGHGWIGFGICCYNKPTSGGTSPQDDSVILEIWFNPDPESDPRDWTMLKRTEDKKGRGWTSQPNKCNGDKDQIGVWSNAHNRLKSNSTSGTIEFKNISFREIDPFGSFDDTGGGTGGTPPPDTGGPPPTTTTIQGVFTLLSDIDVARGGGACQGAGGGGGAGGTTKFYSVIAANLKALSDSTAHDNRKRVAQKIDNSSSVIKGKIIKQLDVQLRKTGSPGASPVVNAKIWDSTGLVVYTSPTTLDPSTLTTSFAPISFDFSTNTYACQVGDRIGVEYLGTSDTDFVYASYSLNTEPTSLGASNSFVHQYEGTSWDGFPDRDFSCDMWE